MVQAMRDLSGFTSVEAHAKEVASAEGGDQREVRAVLDVVSDDWDPVLMWTNDPWPYLNYRRVSATRFIWKSFLLGEIYLGRTSPSYVLPHTWDWFRDDLEESEPRTYLKSNGGEMPPETPFAEYVDDNFVEVYPGSPIPVSYRHDVAEQILDPAVPDLWNAPAAPERSDTGWHFGPGTASYREAGGRDVDLLPIAAGSCFALSGEVSSDGPPGGLVFWFDDTEGDAETVNLSFDGDHASSASANVEFQRTPSEITTYGDVPARFSLIVGERAAALVVNGKIRAAIEIPESVNVSLRSHRGILDVRDLRTGPLPEFTGC
jgi:hypothetical protein